MTIRSWKQAQDSRRWVERDIEGLPYIDRDLSSEELGDIEYRLQRIVDDLPDLIAFIKARRQKQRT